MRNEVTNNRKHGSCHLLCANHCSKCFICTILLNNHNNPTDSYDHLLGYRLSCCNKMTKAFGDLDKIEMCLSPQKGQVGC